MRQLLIVVILIAGCSMNKGLDEIPNFTVDGSQFYAAQGQTIEGTTAHLSHPVYAFAKYQTPSLQPEPKYIYVMVANVEGACWGLWHDGVKWNTTGPYYDDFELPACTHWAVACNADESCTVIESVIHY